MATKGGGSGRGEGGAKELAAQISKTLKEGEKLLAPTRRPDGTLRKPIRIRAGFVPQDEVAVYKSKGSKVHLFYQHNFILALFQLILMLELLAFTIMIRS